jgi:hypothetical protein
MLSDEVHAVFIELRERICHDILYDHSRSFVFA